MARTITYRGKSDADLAQMSIEDSYPLLTSRARRALKRAMANKAYTVRALIKKVALVKKANPGKTIKTQVREAVILPEWLGLTFGVHNGKEYKTVPITIEKVGYRLGDFAHTTSRVLHSGPGVGATRGSKFIPLK
ncbi:MAG: ribosomal protein S19 family protein [Candidatus Micrarchaeia archaeon]